MFEECGRRNQLRSGRSRLFLRLFSLASKVRAQRILQGKKSRWVLEAITGESDGLEIARRWSDEVSTMGDFCGDGGGERSQVGAE